MTDPFVQRMMARSQARRGQNKENAEITDSTRNRLKQLNARYTDDTQPPMSPLRTSNSDIAGSSNDQPPLTIRNLDASPKNLVKSPVKDYSTSSTKSNEVTTSPSRPRLNALVRRRQQMNDWEDDYSYHSTSNSCQVEVEGSISSKSSINHMHGYTPNMHATNNGQSETPHISINSNKPSKMKDDSPGFSELSNVPAKKDNTPAQKPSYYFGDGPSGIASKDGGGSEPLSEYSKLPLPKNMPAAVSSSSSCSLAHKSSSKFNNSTKKTPVPQAERFLSPTRKLAWDQSLLHSLEAQGYTPTESHSRLYYDFKTPEEEEPPAPVPVSPSKVKGMSLAEFMRNSPPKGRSSVRDNSKSALASSNQSSSMHANHGAKAPAPPPPPPVILSCHPKSPASSPVRSLSRIPSPEPQSKGRNRDCSPSKVGEMRSRWEQHIRDASPERLDRSRSPIKSHSRAQSPVKSHSNTHLRPGSPVKSHSNTHLRPGSPVKSHSNTHLRPGSPVKDSSPKKFVAVVRQISHEQVGGNHLSPERRSLRDLSPLKDQGRVNNFGAERTSRRDLSPHKPPPVGDIVKGEAPMPTAVPLVNDAHMSSVRARAAAFDSAGGPRVPEKDPAERSVQERRALFSKNQGTALVPKAPFGQSVPAKNLHGDGSHANRESSNVTSVAHSHPVHKPTKRVAVEPSPVITQKLQQIQKGRRSPSPSSFDSQRMQFENVKDNWRENEINSKIQAERQKEMDVLMNRFRRPKPQPQQYLNERPKYNAESETEYAESDESYAESTASDDASRFNGGTSGPPKPPRLYLDSVSSESSVVSSSPPPPPSSFSDSSPVQKIRSPRARLNSTEIHESCKSPKKEYVPKIKPGCLFPSLSDIESHSEVPDSQDEDDVQDSSFAESVLTCASIESLGQKIKQVAQSNMNKHLSTISEQTEIPSSLGYTMSQSTMEAIEAIDNAIDEALDDEPTPPKRQRTHENVISNVYKTPKINAGSPCRDEDDQSSLAHSISMYRKQKPDVPCTPVRQIVRHPDLRSPTPEPPESPSVTVSARIRELQEEVAEQQRVISQASNAVTVVLQHIEHQGTPQHVEAEKLLLLATQRRQTALDEIQRLKTEGALAQHSWSVEVDTCRGSISISNISVPLKQDFIKKGINGHEVYHLIVLVKHREQVISSQLLATPSCVVDGSITFPNLMSLHNLASDFIISLEVYALRTQQERQMAIKKEQSRMKLTPLKRLQKSESRMASPAIQSPGGPYAVRSSSFQLVGFTHLNITTLTRNAWTLEKVPFSSPLDGHLLMRVSCSFEGGITERGFLTMFEDIGGFGAWNRRWCVINGMFLRYWRYPDDETKKEAIGQIDLRSCTTRRVELVSRDICARQHTFQLVCLRPAYSGDVSNLVQEIQGSSVVTKHLLSSDSKEERIHWCNKLNKSLANIRAWDPDALRPEDYQV